MENLNTNETPGGADARDCVPRLVRECVTHHHACDCREARYAAIEKEANRLMRVCYDEANRLANHASEPVAKRVMQDLYAAGNEAKKILSNVELSCEASKPQKTKDNQ